MDEIFISRDGEQYGPYSQEELKNGLTEGTFSPSDQAWKEGMTDWVELHSLLQSATPPPPTLNRVQAPKVKRVVQKQVENAPKISRSVPKKISFFGKWVGKPLKEKVAGVAVVVLVVWIIGAFGWSSLTERRQAENRRLKAERMKPALVLRDKVVDHKWDSLFEKKIGTPTRIIIYPGGVSAPPTGQVDLNGTANIDGSKYEFSLSFKNGKPIQDKFRISKAKRKPPSSQPSSKGDMHGAWAYMQLFVEARLKNPKGAKFVGYARDTVTHLGGGKYRVRAAVDATNGFGATVRTPFTGVIEDVGGKWKLHELNM